MLKMAGTAVSARRTRRSNVKRKTSQVGNLGLEDQVRSETRPSSQFTQNKGGGHKKTQKELVAGAEK